MATGGPQGATAHRGRGGANSVGTFGPDAGIPAERGFGPSELRRRLPRDRVTDLRRRAAAGVGLKDRRARQPDAVNHRWQHAGGQRRPGPHRGVGLRRRERDERADARDCADPGPNGRLEWRNYGATRELPTIAAWGAARARGTGQGDQGSEHDASDPNPEGPGDDRVRAGQWNARNADHGGPGGGRGLGEEWRNLRGRWSVDSRPGTRHCNVPPLIALI